MPKLIVMLRVKDGILFAAEWLACFEKIADAIVVLDNGSTDGTLELLSAHPKVVEMVQTVGFHEGRDKNLLYETVRTYHPDWCIWVDIDEVFEPALTRAHFDRLMRTSIVKKFAFRRFHFIDRQHFAGSWFRLNYSAGPDRLMWKESPTGYFEDFVLDSPNVKGITGLKMPMNFRLKHLGYIDKAMVDKKAEMYRGITPDKETTLQEMYMRGERAIKWRDERNHPKVLLINTLLNILLLKQWGMKAYNRTIGKLLARKINKPGIVRQLTKKTIDLNTKRNQS